MRIDDLVLGSDAYRASLCRQVTDDSGIASAMIEKDLWVTYVLKKIFVYPKSFMDSYITPDVKLEIGPLASWTPSERKPITCLVGELEPQLEIESFSVPVIKTERTFWEKIEALHHEHYRPETKWAPKRFSRHYYDVFRMYKAGVFEEAKQNLDLLKDIVAFTAKFYPRSWAHFELCKPGTMLLQPSEHALPVMRADYRAMRQMIYGEYPSFDELLSTLDGIESDINDLA